MTERPRAAHGWARPALAVVLVAVLAGLIGSLTRCLSTGIETICFGFDYTTAPGGVAAAPVWRRLGVAVLAGLVCGICWRSIRPRPTGMPPGIAEAVGPEPARCTRMPAATGIADALAQLLIVGSGISLGREAAPRILAAVGGQAVLDRTRLGGESRRLLIGSAAGAGLAAVYNAPIAATCYTLELIVHPDLRTRRGWVHAGLVALVCAIATAVSWLFNHDEPSYAIPSGPADGPINPWVLVLVAAALVVGWGFNALIGAARRHVPPTRLLVRTVPLGSLAVAALAIWQPLVVGNGQVAVQAVLTGSLAPPALVALLMAKSCGTAMALVTGSTGGLLTPSLAVGACTGGIVGVVAGADPATTAVLTIAGAGCVLALNQKAPLFAAFFAIELTRAPLPVAVAVLLAVWAVCCLDRLVTGALRRCRH
ncbi:chloride channel protein [Propionibacterium australiense]|uniref:Voltage gated chloride channel n=1 Tax=Propionibacterium australiense TaxID=119981 RepID=A0A383S4Z1_9ACTN|nr:chloride channel protein [Propionibacterium australiense]RLP11613.1 chloride channel protein [Propionibacterium australiense]SYZ32336.1 Voltage gated chloride channel [Propionibacterium australiense]VEH90414.1 H(+)/Cl(-) exchange transporter ClcA [Propionibacterium australiense]